MVLDAGGKIASGRGEVGGDPLVVVLTQAVADSQLAGLREEASPTSLPESGRSTWRRWRR